MQVWNRKELIETPEVGAGAMRFAYENPIGRGLTKAQWSGCRLGSLRRQ
ncbi:MAG: hypothetical protein ACI3VY_03495 [Faecousia sp.]